jgi:ubiquinone/menaquinone biosynthesis C-methylase UbiE
MDLKDQRAGLAQSHFWSQARTNFISVLMNKIPTGPTHTILDIGAGTGENISALKDFGRVYALDIDHDALALIPQNIVAEKKVGSACAIPYPDKFFDVIVAFDVMEHIEQDDVMIKEIARTLKPGGFIVLTVPAFNFLYGAHDIMLKHHRRYNKPMLNQRFSNFIQHDRGYWYFSLFIPSALYRLITKRITEVRLEYAAIPSIVNSLCFHILSVENWCIKRGLGFPWGLTLFGIYQKK